MRCESWMAHDERTPDEIWEQRLRNKMHEEAELQKRLTKVRSDLAEMHATKP